MLATSRQACRTPEPHNAYEHPPLYPADERLLKEAGKPCLFGRAALHDCDFCRIHRTLRVTPAMAAGVSDRVWDMADIAALIAAEEAPVAKRGPYKRKAA